jgi:hypothetical protein
MKNFVLKFINFVAFCSFLAAFVAFFFSQKIDPKAQSRVLASQKNCP